MNNSTRKLAAIVFTDIVGFTKLTSKDQSQASSLLKTQRKVFQPIVAQFNGSWIKEMGDGLILTFETVTDAVNCCIKLQDISKQIDNLSLRIGIHEGEILIEHNDIIGDDVNIAARIEPFSAPGGIAISNKVLPFIFCKFLFLILLDPPLAKINAKFFNLPSQFFSCYQKFLLLRLI